MIYYKKWHLALFVRNLSFLANVAGCVILLTSFMYWRKIRLKLKSLDIFFSLLWHTNWEVSYLLKSWFFEYIVLLFVYSLFLFNRELKKLKAYLWTCPGYRDRYTWNLMPLQWWMVLDLSNSFSVICPKITKIKCTFLLLASNIFLISWDICTGMDSLQNPCRMFFVLNILSSLT